MGSFSLPLLFFSPNLFNFNFFYLFIAWKWWKIGLRKWYAFIAGHGFAKNLKQRLQYVLNSEPIIMDKSLGALSRFWGVFQFTQVQPLPSPHKRCCTRVSRIFSEFQLCIVWGGGRTARKFWKVCTALRGNREMTEKYEFCSTVPRGFVQDCRLVTMSRKSDHVTRYWPYRGVGTCAFSSPKPLGLICNRPVAKKRRALRTRMVRVLQG